MTRSLRLALVVAPVLALPTFATTWTIDDDGPAQFTSVDAAQAVAQFNDVLLVAPGTYPAFHLTKALKVLGPASGPQPQFGGTSTVASTPFFTLAGLSMQVLEVSNVGGRGVIDDCTLAANNQAAVLRITGCDQLAVSRCTITGTQGYGGYEAAVEATESVLEWTDNDVFGGHAYSGDAAWGQDGISLHQCVAWITASSATGGHGGGGGLCGSCSGNGGDGLKFQWSSVRVRGSSNDGFEGGGAPFGSGSNGADVRVLEGSTLAWSGIATPAIHTYVGAVSVHADPASPAMTIAGSDVGRETRRVLLRGPAGAPAVLAMGTSAGLQGFAGFEGVLWFGPNSLLATYVITLQGQETASAKSFQLPQLAGLEGLTVWFQAVYPTLPGEFSASSMLLGNASCIVLRHD